MRIAMFVGATVLATALVTAGFAYLLNKLNRS